MGEAGEEAERLRDPTHVRNYTEDEWRAFFEAAGLEVEESSSRTSGSTSRRGSTAPGLPDEDADRVRELLADRVEDGSSGSSAAIFKARKR